MGRLEVIQQRSFWLMAPPRSGDEPETRDAETAAEKVVKEIRRGDPSSIRAEEKIRIVMSGLRGEISRLCAITSASHFR